eukprot:218638-Chlamydomonas_euryale.AAC.1
MAARACTTSLAGGGAGGGGGGGSGSWGAKAPTISFAQALAQKQQQQQQQHASASGEARTLAELARDRARYAVPAAPDPRLRRRGGARGAP